MVCAEHGPISLCFYHASSSLRIPEGRNIVSVWYFLMVLSSDMLSSSRWTLKCVKGWCRCIHVTVVHTVLHSNLVMNDEIVNVQETEAYS